MPFKPLMSKIRCQSSNKIGSRIANRNNLNYIATRAGVDISELKDQNSIDEIIREHEKSRKININEEYLYKESDNDTYLKYMAERPRSHGLFGNVDTSDLDSISNEVYNLTKQGRNIYRGIISLSQKDAELLDFTNKDSWNNYLNSVMPDIAKGLGISNIDFTWVGAFHAEKKHPHVHYQLWDNRDRVQSPFIHKSKQASIRLMLSNEMYSDEYNQLVKELTAPERTALYDDKNKGREELTTYLKNVLIDFKEYVPGIHNNTLFSRISNEDIKKLGNQLITLIDNLPKNGRLEYKFMPPEIKTEIDNISNLVLNQHYFKLSFDKYVEITGAISEINGRSKFEIKMDKDKASTDLYKRMGNIILKASKDLLNKKDNILNILDNYYNDDSENNTNSTITFSDDIENNNKYNIDISDFDSNFTTLSKSLWNNDLKQATKEFYNNRNYTKAIKLFEKCAKTGNPIALEKLGMIYSKGLGVDINNDLAATYYTKSYECYNSLLTNCSTDKLTCYINYRLGKMYENGLGTNIDYDKAKECYKYAIENGENKYAMYSLGKIYLDTKGITDNEEVEEYKSKSFNYLKKSADLQFGYAAYQTANLYKQGLYTNQNNNTADKYYKCAFEEFKKMSLDYEDDNVLYRLGQMTYDGLGTKQDTNIAIEYLEKSMELKNENSALLLSKIYIASGDTEKLNEAISILTELSEHDNNRANYSLGRIYATKENILYDVEKAIKYYELAASDNNQHAQYGLGKIYADKETTYYDEEKAIHYYNLSAEQDNSYAHYGLGKIYSDESSKFYDFNKAIDYFIKSADNKNEYAASTLGTLYSNNNSELYNLDKAIQYLNQASDADNTYATLKLAHIYEDNTNNKYYSLDQAENYYKKAFTVLNENVTQRTDYNEYNQIAGLYIEGKGTNQDVVKGLYYLTTAADANDSKAQYTLGRMYLWGTHVNKDEEKGLKYLTQSANNGNEYAKESITFYDDFITRQGTMAAYDVFKIIHTMLSTQNTQNMSTYNTLKAFRNRSKQAIKEEALRQRVQGAKFEQEL